jgi:hypothetical protein
MLESIVAVGWPKIGPKGSPVLILYSGDLVEPGVEAVNSGLDRGLIESGRVYRGFQVIYNASVDRRPPSPSKLYPAGVSSET